MSRRNRDLPARLLPALLLVGACAAAPTTTPEARHQNAEAVAEGAGRIAGIHPLRYVVVQDGGIVAAASAADDAVRAAERASSRKGGVLHRYVFRPSTAGERLYRLAFVSGGGVVAGRGFFDDLGLAATWRPGAPLALTYLGSTVEVDLEAEPRLAVEVTSLDREHTERLSAVVDLDFDGGLLLPPDVAARFAAHTSEIPGDAEVQVALGRPFRARRALLLARIAPFSRQGPVEIVHEARPPERDGETPPSTPTRPRRPSEDAGTGGGDRPVMDRSDPEERGR